MDGFDGAGEVPKAVEPGRRTPSGDPADDELRTTIEAWSRTVSPRKQPSVADLVADRNRRRRRVAPLAIGDGVIAAALATVLTVQAVRPTTPTASPNPALAVPTTGATSDVAEPPASIDADGRTYRLVGPVPWHEVTADGSVLAVTTGPDIRGACDTELYRLFAERRDGALLLTTYEYQPEPVPQAGVCPDIGLPPFTATIDLGAPVSDTAAIDATDPSAPARPIVRVLVPGYLPAGVQRTTDQTQAAWPQVPDPERPDPFGRTQYYASDTVWVTVSQEAERIRGRAVGGHDLGQRRRGDHRARHLVERRSVSVLDRSGRRATARLQLDGRPHRTRSRDRRAGQDRRLATQDLLGAWSISNSLSLHRLRADQPTSRGPVIGAQLGLITPRVCRRESQQAPSLVNAQHRLVLVQRPHHIDVREHALSQIRA